MITHFGYFCLLVYVAGETHLNSDAKIADEGCPQGAPLPDSGSLTWLCPNLMPLPCH